VLAALLLDMVPVAVFAAVGNAMLATPLGDTINAKLVVLAVVNAYVVVRLVMCVTRIFVSPLDRRLRLIQCQDAIAAYTERWVRRIAVVAVFGFALAEVGLLFGLWRSAHSVLLKLVGLAVHIMLIVVVLQCRHAVTQRLRPRRRSTGFVAALQNQLAAQWYIVAIFYIAALWLVAAAEIQNGYVRLLHFCFATVAVMLCARLVSIGVLGGVNRMTRLGPATQARHPGLQARLNTYYPPLRLVLSGLLTTLTLLALLTVWGFNPLNWFSTGQLGEQVLSAFTTSGMTVAIAVVVWEATNVAVERHLAGLARQAQMARAARLRTLLPMLKTALLVAILIIVGLIVLSQIGVNIAPLLAGAGVLGVAIGFGSQKLVQDLITGLFLLLENAMQVGDIVSLGGLTGTVENLSIRTIRLRATDGSVHIIPFSSVTTVTNQTRDFGYSLLDLAVGLDESPDRIAELVSEIAEDMRAEARWKDAITADLEVMGVQAFGDHEWILRARLRTTPSQRWAVSREFNRRIKYRFDELAIQSPITSYRVQGWMPPGAERMLPPATPEPPVPEPALPHPERAAS
jgi:moderate conductance mechanosensitive channel